MPSSKYKPMLHKKKFKGILLLIRKFNLFLNYEQILKLTAARSYLFRSRQCTSAGLLKYNSWIVKTYYWVDLRNFHLTRDFDNLNWNYWSRTILKSALYIFIKIFLFSASQCLLLRILYWIVAPDCSLFSSYNRFLFSLFFTFLTKENRASQS